MCLLIHSCSCVVVINLLLIGLLPAATTITEITLVVLTNSIVY